MLLKNPGFAAIAFASIGGGVGANAAMFSVADGRRWRIASTPKMPPQSGRTDAFETPYGRGKWISLWADGHLNWR